jgi:hypothetical protein
MIRPMTRAEVAQGLRRAAEICLEQGRICWGSIDVCRADDVYLAADAFADQGDDLDGYANTPDQAAYFLLLCAEALA